MLYEHSVVVAIRFSNDCYPFWIRLFHTIRLFAYTTCFYKSTKQNISDSCIIIILDTLLLSPLVNFTFSFQSSSLFSDIGGTLGLYIGFSIITAIEFLVLIYEFCRMCGKGSRKPTPQEPQQQQAPYGQWPRQHLNFGGANGGQDMF